MVRHFRTALVLLPAILVAGVLVWLFFFTLDESDAQTAAKTAIAVAPDISAPQPQSPPAAVEPATEPLGHLRISRASFARGGLGSKALVTFTLRNDNNYAVKDAEILCAFRSRDGRYAT